MERSTTTKVAARVLVAEDDDEMRRLVVHELERDGHEVEAVSSGSSLLERLAAGLRPDALVTDLRMPGMDGLDALRRAVGPHGWVPAVLITAFPDGAVFERAASAGVEVLSKPFDLAELRRAVRRALEAADLFFIPEHEGYEPIRRR